MTLQLYIWKKSNYFTDEIRPDLDFSKNAIEATKKQWVQQVHLVIKNTK